ncbi:hypothetical protein JCM15519_27530 [Fundidesulfovibrio butyratiphilus]
MNGRIDFARINAAALANLPALLERWLPGGKREGGEWVCGSIGGEPGSSCSTNLATCVGGDFAGEARWNDPVSLYAALQGLKQGEAARKLARELGLDPGGGAAPSGTREQARKRVVAAYDYLGADGQLVFQVTRWEPKTFTQRRPDGQGGWIPSVKGIDLVPYRLPEVLIAGTVYVPEGEKDVHAIEKLGLTATCNAMGAGKWRPEYNSHFQGKVVVILPDNDEPGRKHAQDVAAQLHGIAEAVKVLDLPGLPPKGDVSDWLGAGGTREALVDLAKAAQEWKPSGDQAAAQARAFRFLPLDEILAVPRPTRWLIRDYLEAESLSVLFGEAGSMKSFLAIDQGLCIASGTPWHGHAVPNPGPVFYLAGEGFHGLAKRIRAWTVAHGVDPATTSFFVSSAPAQLLDADGVADVVGAVAKLAEQHGQPRLVTIDTLNRNFGAGDENSSQDMTAFVAALDALKARFGCAILVVHHSGLANKDRSRGSSVLRAALDFEYRLAARGEVRVLSCTKSKDCEPPQDMAFEPGEIGTGWTDPETLREITSCVLRLATLAQSTALPKAQQVALDALVAACEVEGGPVAEDIWRAATYAGGMSDKKPDARRKAFLRARRELTDAGLVREVESLWEASTTGTSGTCPGHLGNVPSDTTGTSGTHPYKGCPMSRVPVPAEEVENPFRDVSHG